MIMRLFSAYRPVAVVVKDIVTTAEVLGSIPGPVKSDTVSYFYLNARTASYNSVTNLLRPEAAYLEIANSR